MKKQTHTSKMHESLGERHGKESTKKQSMTSRTHEAKGAKKGMKNHEAHLAGEHHIHIHHHHGHKGK